MASPASFRLSRAAREELERQARELKVSQRMALELLLTGAPPRPGKRPGMERPLKRNLVPPIHSEVLAALQVLRLVRAILADWGSTPMESGLQATLLALARNALALTQRATRGRRFVGMAAKPVELAPPQFTPASPDFVARLLRAPKDVQDDHPG